MNIESYKIVPMKKDDWLFIFVGFILGYLWLIWLAIVIGVSLIFKSVYSTSQKEKDILNDLLMIFIGFILGITYLSFFK